MIRRVLGAAILAAVSATAAQAQVDAQFHASNTGTFYYNAKGVFTSGAAGVGGNFSNNSTFQIWCVDQRHTADFSTYDVKVSQLSGNLSETRVGDADTYAKAAFLANGMTSGNQKTNQYAMWAIIHGRSASDQCSSFLNGSLGSCTSTAAVTTAIGNANSGFTTIDKSEWYVITDDDAYQSGWYYDGGWKNGRHYTDEGAQEFLAKCQSAAGMTAGNEVQVRDCNGLVPPSEEAPTPEPATMSLIAMGLAGMAGSSLRRRRKAAK